MVTQTRSNLFVGSLAVLIVLAAAGAFSVSAHGNERNTEKRGKQMSEFIDSLPEDVRMELDTLRENGDRDAVRVLLDENGIEPPTERMREMRNEWLENVPEELRDELRALHESGDMEAVHDFLEENDIERPMMGRKMHRVMHRRMHDEDIREHDHENHRVDTRRESRSMRRIHDMNGAIEEMEGMEDGEFDMMGMHGGK